MIGDYLQKCIIDGKAEMFTLNVGDVTFNYSAGKSKLTIIESLILYPMQKQTTIRVPIADAPNIERILSDNVSLNSIVNYRIYDTKNEYNLTAKFSYLTVFLTQDANFIYYGINSFNTIEQVDVFYKFEDENIFFEIINASDFISNSAELNGSANEISRAKSPNPTGSNAPYRVARENNVNSIQFATLGKNFPVNDTFDLRVADFKIPVIGSDAIGNKYPVPSQFEPGFNRKFPMFSANIILLKN